MKKRFCLLAMATLLISSVASVGAATYVNCGSTKNTRYSTISGTDANAAQVTAGEWRHTAPTNIYVKDKGSDTVVRKQIDSRLTKATVQINYVAQLRSHDHYATDHFLE